MQSCLPRRFKLRHSPLSRSHWVTQSCRRASTCEEVSAAATRVLALTCVDDVAASESASAAASPLVDVVSIGGSCGGGVSVGGGMESATLSPVLVSTGDALCAG